MSFNDFTRCRSTGCPRLAAVSGFCSPCYERTRRDVRRPKGTHHHGGNTPALTADQVAEARRMRARFKTNREIAAHFGLDGKTVAKVLAPGYTPRPATPPAEVAS